MSFWEKIQKDMKRNIEDGITFFREGSAAVSQKLEEFTEEGRKKYKIFTLKMRVKDEFTKLGGNIYDLSFKHKNPMASKSVSAVIARIKKYEAQISRLENKQAKRTVSPGLKKTRRKSPVK